MTETSNPQDPQPTIDTKPLSIASFGPLSVMVFHRTVTKKTPTGDATKSNIQVSIRRQVMQEGDDPTSIPLTEVPALVSLLSAIVEPAMTVTSMTQVQPQPPAPAPANRAQRRGKKGRKK
jgi:hypothetical protein